MFFFPGIQTEFLFKSIALWQGNPGVFAVAEHLKQTSSFFGFYFFGTRVTISTFQNVFNFKMKFRGSLNSLTLLHHTFYPNPIAKCVLLPFNLTSKWLKGNL